MSKLTAGIILIGDEILSGRTKDANANFIAKELVTIGIKLCEIRIIPDESEIIIKTVRDFSKKYTYVFTTGGIGPTHDDITALSISKAFNKKYKINNKAFKILEKYYPKGEFNESRQKMAMFPENSELTLNSLTAAPGFKIKNVYVFAGVPEIMQNMFKFIKPSLKKGKPKKTFTIKTNLFESLIALQLSEIQKKNSDCSIGSYPYFNFINKSGGVNIVVSSWERDDLSTIKDEIINMISLLDGKSSLV